MMYMRECLIRTGKDDAQYDEKWGYFKPKQRLNVDQSPPPFSCECKKTYEAPQKDQKVWVSSGKSRKRFYSLNICLRPESDQPQVSIIFRGQGIHISAIEREAQVENVDVYFQTSAWVDTSFCVKWAEKTLKSAVEKEDNFVPFCDNLEVRKADLFKDTVKELGRLVWYGVANVTDIWQPIEARYAQLLMMLIKQEFPKWLDDDNNIERWYGESLFSTSEKRILITKLVGNAY